MKKRIVPLLLLLLMTCGCRRTPSGFTEELTRYAWSAALDGGGTLALRFSGDTAFLTMKNGGETATVAGRYAADETTLLIFDDESAQPFHFAYQPKGTTLALTYEGKTVTLTADLDMQ